jgi:hypothetical protein
MLYLFWYNTFIVLFINALYNYLRQGAVIGRLSFLRKVNHSRQFHCRLSNSLLKDYCRCDKRHKV